MQLYWNHTSVKVFSCKFAAYLQNIFFEEHLKGISSDKKKKDDVITATVAHVNMIICDAWETLPFNNLIISQTIAVWSLNQVSKFRKGKVKEMTNRKHYFFCMMYYLCVCVCVCERPHMSVFTHQSLFFQHPHPPVI